MSDYQTHVFTCTYTADVSGVCSAMYELGGMTILHDPSGCNSTYSTHDEPRWYEEKSLMFISGLDEMTAVFGDDQVLIDDVVHAARDLNPGFITLCGGAMPHIIAFDYKGVAHLIEGETGLPVIPVPTDGLKSYISGVGKALTAWIKRFANQDEIGEGLSVNLLGVTPLDFSINGNVETMRREFEEAGIPVNCCAAMGEDFESLTHIYQGTVNVVVSSAGRRPARYMERMAGIPRVEGIPIGKSMSQKMMDAVRIAYEEHRNVILYKENEDHDRWSVPEDQILIIGEEIFAQTLAAAINTLDPEKRFGLTAYALWPDVDEGFPERELIMAMRQARIVIADPLYKVVLRREDRTVFIPFPHEAYSGRIYRKKIPLFTGSEYEPEILFEHVNLNK